MDTEETAGGADDEYTEAPITPDRAINDMIFLLLREKRGWKKREDPNGVLPHIEKQIAALELARKQLERYRAFKFALERFLAPE
jgi:hypothetical protein